jgi:hypothetical protein
MPPISQNRTLSEEEKRVGKNRADFMRRFFSVAVSVGFASKLRDFRFLSSLQDISSEELRQFMLLVFAMIIVVGSCINLHNASIIRNQFRELFILYRHYNYVICRMGCSYNRSLPRSFRDF